jgi:hypothetical protein
MTIDIKRRSLHKIITVSLNKSCIKINVISTIFIPISESSNFDPLIAWRTRSVGKVQQKVQGSTVAFLVVLTSRSDFLLNLLHTIYRL